MIREIRFWIFSELIYFAMTFLPKDAIKTWKWLSEQPFEK